MTTQETNLKKRSEPTTSYKKRIFARLKFVLARKNARLVRRQLGC
jgi:hypothetical protein